MTTDQARKFIRDWPESIRIKALHNIEDAEHDLRHWPEHKREILRDMTEAIKAWELEILEKGQ